MKPPEGSKSKRIASSPESHTGSRSPDPPLAEADENAADTGYTEPRAMGIAPSGSSTDGTDGRRTVRAGGGMAMVSHETTATARIGRYAQPALDGTHPKRQSEFFDRSANGTNLAFLEKKSATHLDERRPNEMDTVNPETPAEFAAELHRLNAELIATKDYLQSLISEHQVTTEDLAATNEELCTVNAQLRSRNQELDVVASDLENVLTSVEIPVIIVDHAVRVRRFTPAITDIANFLPEDVGKPIDDLRFKLRVEALSDRIREVIEGASSKEWEVQRQDGCWFRMHIRPYRTLHQPPTGAVVAFLDVDVLKRARKDAETTRDYARNIVEMVTSALVVLDAQLCVTSANAAFLEMFSLPEAQIVGKSLLGLEADLWRMPEVRKKLEESISTHTPFNALEVETQLALKGRRVVSLRGRSIVSNGVASMTLVTIDDVTDLRALEAERELLLASEKRARLEAERANQAKDLFLATLSHELRTPLSTILMSAQLLRRISSGDSRIERASASIERATQAQSRLIDDLLDVSRIVSGKLLLDLEQVDMAKVVETAVDIAKPAVRAKSLDLDLVVDGVIGSVYGDALRLQQVVNNLLTNAIKFTPHGGRIAVRLKHDGKQVQLTVRDNGMGIRPEVLPRLFNRFVQADSSVTRTHGGLGLGLSIVRHLVDAHGGRIKVESLGEKKGATFSVTLPLGNPESSEIATPPRASVRAISGVRVLLVEDDDDTRETYAAMLEELGTVVQTAASAAIGFLAVEEFRPQVIFSDIAMPGEDGFSFIQRVRRLAPNRGGCTPAAALTALTSKEIRQKTLESGFQMHISKPVDATQLVSMVAALAAWDAKGSVAAQLSTT